MCAMILGMDDSQQTYVTPPSSPQYPTSNMPPRRWRKRTIVLISLGAFLLIAAIVVGVLWLVSSQNKKIDEKPALTLTELGDGLKRSSADPSLASVTTSTSYVSPRLAKKVTETVWVGPQLGIETVSYSVRYDNEASSNATYNTASAYLNEQFGAIAAESASNARYFEGRGVVCVLFRSEEVDGDANKTWWTVSADCAKQENFAKNEDTIKIIANSYVSRTDADATPVIFKSVTTQTISVSELGNAEVIFVKMAEPALTYFGKFYQTKDKQWHFMAAADKTDGVSCSVFASDEQRQAFIGTPCWDATTNTRAYVTSPQPPSAAEDGSSPVD